MKTDTTSTARNADDLDDLFHRAVDFQMPYLAVRTRRVYERLRQRSEPGYRCPAGLHSAEFWGRVVHAATQRRVNPLDLVANAVNSHDVPAWPISLRSPELLSACQHALDQEAYERARTVVGLQTDQLISEVERAGALTVELLKNLRNPVEDLLLWCVAVQNGFGEIEVEYRQRAFDAFLSRHTRLAYYAFRREMQAFTTLDALHIRPVL